MDDMKQLLQLKECLGMKATEMDRNKELLFILKTTETFVTNYCHIDIVPEGLESTIIRMAMDIDRMENVGSYDLGMVTKGITEGDTSVTFDATSSFFSESLLKNYKTQLNRYRKLVW